MGQPELTVRLSCPAALSALSRCAGWQSKVLKTAQVLVSRLSYRTAYDSKPYWTGRRVLSGRAMAASTGA
jgi:hypothetical protein